jgi:hypothetical protein
MRVLKLLKFLFILGCFIGVAMMLFVCQSKEIGKTQEWSLMTGLVIGLGSALGLVITRILIKQKE